MDRFVHVAGSTHLDPHPGRDARFPEGRTGAFGGGWDLRLSAHRDGSAVRGLKSKHVETQDFTARSDDDSIFSLEGEIDRE